MGIHPFTSGDVEIARALVHIWDQWSRDQSRETQEILRKTLMQLDELNPGGRYSKLIAQMLIGFQSMATAADGIQMCRTVITKHDEATQAIGADADETAEPGARVVAPPTAASPEAAPPKTD